VKKIIARLSEKDEPQSISATNQVGALPASIYVYSQSYISVAASQSGMTRVPFSYKKITKKGKKTSLS